ncbi:MAG: alpha/beta hydrolase family protein [Bacteroidales bacterium]
MKRFSILLFVAIFIFHLAALPQNNKRFAGSWAGKLDVGAMKLRLGLNFKDTTGMLVATLDSPDQGAYGIATDKTTVLADAINVELNTLRASYEGTMLPGDSLIEGKWTQGGKSFDLLLHRAEKQVKLKRPQEPVPPYPYKVEEVSFTNKKTGIELAGTLTIPQGDGPFHAVVLITGSGPQNRDEEIMGHKPFLVIADYLSRNGIAVLRYDDRGVGQSKGNFGKATSFDFADDAEAAFEFLEKHALIDKKHTGLAGHSEGGLIAPIIAARNKDVDFIILLAGTGVAGEQILLAQSALIMEAGGSTQKEIEETRNVNNEIYRTIKQEPDSAKAMKLMVRAVENYINADTSIKASEKENRIKENTAGLSYMTTPWMRAFLVLDPQQYLVKVKCPLLDLNGSNDLQVPCEMNQQAIEKAMKAGKNKDYKIVKLDGLNHLFQHSKTGSPVEYSTIEETFAPEALLVIKDWILRK